LIIIISFSFFHLTSFFSTAKKLSWCAVNPSHQSSILRIHIQFGIHLMVPRDHFIHVPVFTWITCVIHTYTNLHVFIHNRNTQQIIFSSVGGQPLKKKQEERKSRHIPRCSSSVYVFTLRHVASWSHFTTCTWGVWIASPNSVTGPMIARDSENASH
jgi:hypothetical protein